MRTYCKKANPEDVEFIIPAVWEAFRKKWFRNDYGRLFEEYSGLTRDDLLKIEINDHYLMYNAKLEPGIRRIAEEVVRRIKARNLELEPVDYQERRDPGSNKIRLVGIETPMHQVIDHVAVWCLMELFTSKIEPCQFASIKGRGQVKGAHLIADWVKQENQKAWYCEQNGYRYSKNTEHYVQGDVRKCYPSMRREMVMPLLRHDISKNEALLWLVNELLKAHKHGFIIGSLLSQFLCNYIMSFAIREVYGYKKARRGQAIKLVYHQVWFMDDFILTGPDARNLKMAYTRLTKYMQERFGLQLKPATPHRLVDKPIDIMGYVIHADGTITIRPRNYLKARRVFSRAAGMEYISLTQARLIVSYKGYFVNSDCRVEAKKLNVEPISLKAQKLISDYETGRLMQCIPKSCSTATTPLLSPNSSTLMASRSTV